MNTKTIDGVVHVWSILDNEWVTLAYWNAISGHSRGIVAEIITGGRVWPFEHDGHAYEIESLNGDSTVRLYEVTPDPQKPDTTVRKIVGYRRTYGASARSVAVSMHLMLLSGDVSER